MSEPKSLMVNNCTQVLANIGLTLEVVTSVAILFGSVRKQGY